MENEEEEEELNYEGCTRKRLLRIHRVYNEETQTTEFYYVSATVDGYAGEYVAVRDVEEAWKIIHEYVDQDDGILQDLGVVYKDECFAVTADYNEDDCSYEICLWKYQELFKCRGVYTFEAVSSVVEDFISQIQ